MSTTTEQIELSQIGLVLRDGEDLAETLGHEFFAALSHSRRMAADYAGFTVDYWLKVDVTDNEPPLSVGEWVALGGDDPREVYAVLRGREEIAGRVVMEFEVCFLAGLPKGSK